MSASPRQLISLACTGVVVLAASIYFAMTLNGWFKIQADTETAIAEQAVPPAADPARYLTPGDNLAVATSNLQSRLNSAARSANVTASRVQISDPDERDPLALRLEFQAEGEMENLAQLLHSLEAGLPALIIEEAQLTPIRRSERLQLTATVSARREPGGDS
ncbi:GspMb/PilO family protein [Hyphobacterium sp.]|uniref:GspMb/PilO family protein n=1 Tax=Hyphobacterium sp. TaxID=2004662 RepID=UPI003BAC35D2